MANVEIKSQEFDFEENLALFAKRKFSAKLKSNENELKFE